MLQAPSLFAQRLADAEERVRRLYLRHEGGGDDALGSGTDQAGQDTGWPDAVGLAELASGGDRLARLAREFALDATDVDVLATCLLPETSPVCGSAFRFLSGLPTSRPTVSVVLSALDIEVPDALRRGLLRWGSPLLETGLITYDNPAAAFPERVLNVSDRLLDFLCGRDVDLGRRLSILPAGPEGPGAVDVPEPADAGAAALHAELVADLHRTRYLRQGVGGEALPAARTALRALGLTPLLVDPDALACEDLPPSYLAEQVALEARLIGAALLLPVPSPGTAAPERVESLRRFAVRLAAEPVPLLLYGFQEWEAYEWEAPAPIASDLRGPAPGGLRDLLGAAASAAVERVHRDGALRGVVPEPEAVRTAARRRSAAELASLSRHIVPGVNREDLVLPDRVRSRLDMLVSRVRHRERVFRDWGLRRGGGRGHGTAALFAGESGTGKTMAAEAVAHELGLDLYVVSLPSLVSKYIGETEKNLERVFSAAEDLDAVVLFDEADSMFAKRGEVKGANDRHANMQSGYLLQRLEAFNGLAVLTTNLRSNIDTAFTRRFDEVVHFESPGADVRALLWSSLLGDAAPEGLPVEALAGAYDLAGGSIRACVESAVFVAAAAGRPLTGEDLLQGVETEYGKLGRLFARVT
ncbi:ATP-binding protein [Streptomyces lavendulae]|uniref:ATP-binding protein n=1 Tax=Streptomyces lavendulae TaxID=1914 RepID=UPI00381D7562